MLFSCNTSRLVFGLPGDVNIPQCIGKSDCGIFEFLSRNDMISEYVNSDTAPEIALCLHSDSIILWNDRLHLFPSHGHSLARGCSPFGGWKIEMMSFLLYRAFSKGEKCDRVNCPCNSCTSTSFVYVCGFLLRDNSRGLPRPQWANLQSNPSSNAWFFQWIFYGEIFNVIDEFSP